MSDTQTRIATSFFKRVPGGYVYRAPRQWPFGPARCYLINADQKAALMNLMVSKWPILSQVIVWSTLCLMVAISCVGTWLYTGHDSPTAFDTLAIVILTVAQVIVALVINVWWNQHRLRPLLATLTPTDLRISRSEMLAAAQNNMSSKREASPKQLVIAGVTAVFASTAMLVSATLQLAWRQPTGLLWLAASFVFAGLAWLHFRRLLARAEKP